MANQLNLVKLAWTHRWLLLLGLLLGLGGGYALFEFTPEVYRSTSSVQVVDASSNNLPVEGLEAGGSSKYLSDEALVMRSERTLEAAAALGRLGETQEFLGLSDPQIAQLLAKSRTLIIEPAETDNDETTIFDLEYEAGDPIVTRLVIDSIIQAYANHLDDRYKKVGEETLRMIELACGDVATRLSDLERQYDEFRQSVHLIERNGESTSVHRANSDKYLAHMQELHQRKSELESRLEAARKAFLDGASDESILIAVTGQSGESAIDVVEDMTDKRISRLKDEKRIVRRSDQVREEKLLPLMMELQEMEGQFAASHPSVKSLQIQAQVLSDTVEQMKVEEDQYERELQSLIASEAAVDGKIDPAAAVRHRLRHQVLAMRQEVRSVEQELAATEKLYATEVESAKSETAQELEAARLLREIERQRTIYDRVVARLEEVELLNEDADVNVFVLDAAHDGYKVAPSKLKSLFIGAFLGLMIFGSLALMLELNNKAYRSPEDLASHLGLPVVGHVPQFRSRTKKVAQDATKLHSSLCTHFSSRSYSAEAFRAIRTAMMFSDRGGDFRVVQVTSAGSGDGKSTIAANVAITIAQSGKSVLLLDADLRRPTANELFGVDSTRGLGWMLSKMPREESPEHVSEMVGEVIHETPIANLSLLPAGEKPSNPSELLSSLKFDRLLDVLKCKFDLVIVDSPPLLAVTDPSNIASRVDGVLLVVRLSKKAKPLAARASRMLETLRANVIGVVVNGVGARNTRTYGGDFEGEACSNRRGHFANGYAYSLSHNSKNPYAKYYDDAEVPIG